MCDWEAEEYAEYLLWVEAEKVRARGPSPTQRERPLLKSSVSVEVRQELAEA
jgi:hypothetical protein